MKKELTETQILELKIQTLQHQIDSLVYNFKSMTNSITILNSKIDSVSTRLRIPTYPSGCRIEFNHTGR
jgi:hypothetical protein